MANIQDVAKLAGVTSMTVSRVINDSGYVKKETRERVEAAIAELNYVPNLLGQSLRFKQTKTIGLLIPDISDPYWVTVIRGVERAASEIGYQVILCDSHTSETKEMDHLENLIKRQIDGILIAPIRNKPEPIDYVQKQGIPIVVIGYPMPAIDVDIVRCDTEEAAYNIVRLLLDLGHRRVAILSGPIDIVTAVDRVNGYKRALSDAGIPADDELIQYGHFFPEMGFEMAQKMLAINPCPTAVVTANNLIAIGAAKAFYNAGVRIPEDISLVTFDGPMPELVIDPFFTMVSQPGREIGKQATDLLLRRLIDNDSFDCQEIILPTEILTYSSTASFQHG